MLDPQISAFSLASFESTCSFHTANMHHSDSGANQRLTGLGSDGASTIMSVLTFVNTEMYNNKVVLNSKCWRGCGEKGTLLHSRWECKLVQPLWRTVWRFLRKLKIDLPCDPVISLLGIYLDKTTIQKDTCTPMFIAALFTIAKIGEQPKCPSTNEWIKKMWYIYTMEY